MPDTLDKGYTECSNLVADMVNALEVNKVADMVADMEVDKVVDMVVTEVADIMVNVVGKDKDLQALQWSPDQRR